MFNIVFIYFYFIVSVTTGFIKTRFLKINSFKDGFATYGLGSITDGIYKVEVKIPNFETIKEFPKGTPVTIRGYINFSSKKIFIYNYNSIYFLILSTN